MQWFSSPWFQRKPVAHLIDEMNSGERLHRRLGPFALMSLGIGATIGTGLYVSTGIVARDIAGPSIMVSFLLAAVGCGFAALCYSELASMVPVAGSAYTYAYATLGELIAWIIGWDLILEYAIGSCYVANSWSSYFDSLLSECLPHPPRSPPPLAPLGLRLREGRLRPPARDPPATGRRPWPGSTCPRVVITLIITVILVIGIKESAGFNAAMVLVNIGVVLTVIGVGIRLRQPGQLATRFSTRTKDLAASRRGRPGSSSPTSVSTRSRPMPRRPAGPSATWRWGSWERWSSARSSMSATAAVLTGMIPYREINKAAPLAAALQSKGLTFAGGMITLGILAGMTSSLLVGNLSQPRIFMAMARDGLLPLSFFGAVHPPVQDAVEVDDPRRPGGCLGGALAPLGFLADLVSIGTLFAFVIVSAAVWILRITDPAVAPAVPHPLRPLRLDHGRAGQRRPDVLAGPRQLDPACSSG